MGAQGAERQWFAQATSGVLEAVDLVPWDLWSEPGLGTWTVRELVAHTARAWTTTATYLSDVVPHGDEPLVTPAEYFVRALAIPGVHDGVAQRARDDVAALGADPAEACRRYAASVTRLVDSLPDDRRLLTPGGIMQLSDYLETRAFELTVHGLDLCRAIDLDVPADLAACAAPSLELAAQIAGARGTAVTALEALTGRGTLPTAFSILS